MSHMHNICVLNRKLVRTSIYDFGSFIFLNPEDAYKAEIVVTQVPKLGDRTLISFL